MAPEHGAGPDEAVDAARDFILRRHGDVARITPRASRSVDIRLFGWSWGVSALCMPYTERAGDPLGRLSQDTPHHPLTLILPRRATFFQRGSFRHRRIVSSKLGAVPGTGFLRTLMMAADPYDIEHIALDLIEQLGDFAAPVARELAVEAVNAQDDWLLPAGIWQDIINTIDRLLSDYGKVQWLTIH